MANLPLKRKVGDRSPIELVAYLGETVDISGLTVVFFMTAAGFTTPRKVDGVAAGKSDVTTSEKAAGRIPADAPTQSAWLLSYAPTLADVDTAGHYLCEFKITYAGSQDRFYPPGNQFIALELSRR